MRDRLCIDVQKAPIYTLGSRLQPTAKRARGVESIEPKTVSPCQRVDEFPDQCLPVTENGGSNIFATPAAKNLLTPKRLIEPRCFNITRAEIQNLSLPVYRN